MTRIFRPLPLIAFCLLCSCSRTTFVSGRVTNIRTGNPVVGMPVSLSIYNGHDPQDSSNPKKVGTSSTLTGPDGEYTLELSGKGIDEAGLQLDEGRLCFSYFEAYRSDNVVENEAREVNIQIDSIDGRLQLVLENETGQFPKLYVRVDCDATGDKGIYCCNTNVENSLSAGQTTSHEFPVSANRYVWVYWGTDPFTGWNAPAIDSVYCPRGQTTPFVIKF